MVMLTLPFSFPSLKGTLVEGQVEKHRCLTVEGALNKKLLMGSGEGEATGVGVEGTEKWGEIIFMVLSFTPHP